MDTKQEYERWDKAHGRMATAPPSDGHHYIQHALNLLDLLKLVGEIHPVVKVVVSCFEQLVLFEKDRQENDGRVASVVLAQSGMMRVLLDIDDLAARQSGPDTVRVMLELPQLLNDVQNHITACHNSIDTYYREHRLVKFYKAKDWKTKILEFIRIFDHDRVLLHQALSLQVASNVNDLVSKMDLLLGRLFSPQEPWELDVIAKMRDLRVVGNADWLNDNNTVKSLAVSTGDMSVNLQADPSNVIEAAQVDLQVNTIKEHLRLSIDTLCSRNLELFERKLKLHTEKLEKAILQSARFVITSLSGPHDRLEHEDIRALWKEMNWMFCVESKVFGIALFEYYLDLYSKGMSKSHSPDIGLWMPKSNALYRFRSASYKHPDAWTLVYLFLYADKIANMIDSDKSGLIRISEANAFTSQIPEEWTLPQWCAYLVEGQFHENTLYRKRLLHIWCKIQEMHIQVLSHNRLGAADAMHALGVKVLHYLILEPRDHKQDVPIADELHELVKTKMIAQDENFHSRLASLSWTIDSPSTIQVLSDGRPLETFIYPLLTTLMEFMMDIHHLAVSKVFDMKEWSFPYLSFYFLEAEIDAYLFGLKLRIEGDFVSSDNLRSYHGGIWTLFEQSHPNGRIWEAPAGHEIQLVPVLQQDYDSFYSDQSFLEDFPLPHFTGSLLHLRYDSWDDYKQGKDPADIPLEQPFTWNPIDDRLNSFTNTFAQTPFAGWNCDKCQRKPGSERSWKCLECHDFDFCQECHKLAPPDHKVSNHTFNHRMFVRATWVQAFRRAWINFRSKELTLKLLDATKDNSDADSNYSEDAGSSSGGVMKSCELCDAQIDDSESEFYICGEYSCTKKDVYLCKDCAWINEGPEKNGHFWWHTLLPFGSRIVQVDDSTTSTGKEHLMAEATSETKTYVIPVADEEGNDPVPLLIDNMPPSDTSGAFPVTGSVATSPESMMELDSKISHLESKVGQRINAVEARLTGIEQKLDAGMAELKTLMEALLSSRS